MKNVKYIRPKEWYLLVTGILITVLYIVFATPFYDILYPGSAQFSNQMYNQNMYLVVAVLTSVIVWVIAIFYYWIIDRFPRFWSWFIAFVLALAFAPSVTFVYPDQTFQEMDLDLSIDLANFALVKLAVTGVLFFITSLCIKGFSKNCATTPF